MLIQQFYVERLDGMYNIIPYFFARFVVQMPVTVSLALIYGIPIYWMAGFQVRKHLIACLKLYLPP